MLMYQLLFLSLFSVFNSDVSSHVESRFVVYIFMGEDCVISQNYTLPLKQLYDTYADQSVDFYGVFPNRYSTNEKMKAFRDKYDLPFEFILDKGQIIMNKFEVKITPEVVVWDKELKQIRYQGRIDNTYFQLGKRRSITTSSELQDAIQALLDKKEVVITRTKAIGCIITPVDENFKDLSTCHPVKND